MRRARLFHFFSFLCHFMKPFVNAGKARKLQSVSSPRIALIFIITFTFLCLPSVVQSSGAGEDETGPPLSVAADKVSLTVRASDVPLGKVLQEVSRQAGITVYGEPHISNEKITVEFKDLTITEGLEKVLSRYNYSFVFSQSPPRLTEVWVFSRGKDVSSNLKGPQKEINFVSLSGGKAEVPDPSIRRMAVEAMEESKDRAMIPVLLNFLRDPDRSVRLATIDALSNYDDPLLVDNLVKIALAHEDPETRIAAITAGFFFSSETLAHLALTDQSPAVRIQALHALEGSEEIEEVARESLMKDPDPTVQDTAREILQTLEEDRNSQINE